MILNISNPEKAKKTLIDREVSAENADKFIKAAKHFFESKFDMNREDDDNEEPIENKER